MTNPKLKFNLKLLTYLVQRNHPSYELFEIDNNKDFETHARSDLTQFIIIRGVRRLWIQGDKTVYNNYEKSYMQCVRVAEHKLSSNDSQYGCTVIYFPHQKVVWENLFCNWINGFPEPYSKSILDLKPGDSFEVGKSSMFCEISLMVGVEGTPANLKPEKGNKSK